MSIQEKLATFKEIGELALKGKSDEEIAKGLSMNVFNVTKIRQSLGVYKAWRLNLTEEFKKANFGKGYNFITFSIPRTIIADAGLDSDKQIEFGKIKVLGKGKVVLTIRNV